MTGPEIPDPRSVRRLRRRALHLCRHLRHRLRTDRDRLTAEQGRAFAEAGQRLGHAARSMADPSAVAAAADQLEATVGPVFPHLRRAALRHPFELLLVPLVIAIAVRTFLAQPFSIPTGSMQPTLFGIATQNLLTDPQARVPGPLARLRDRWVYGISYLEILAEADGRLEELQPAASLGPFARHRFRVGPVWYELAAPVEQFADRVGLQPDRVYRRGEPIVRAKLTRGDHILVDRLSYNFRRLRRGEIVVFGTEGIPELAADQYYVKRLVGLAGEAIQIGDDRHVVVNGRRLDASTPGFSSLYTSVHPGSPNAYLGHLNRHVATMVGLPRPDELAPRFPDGRSVFHVRPGHCLLLGDNTLFSLDSRAWGDLPRDRLRGRAIAVYWPWSPRIGFCGP